MLVEIHVLQNFAPSNLNRDDTGAPKDCIFGGYRRARVSSQCWKRATRIYVRERGLLGEADLARRTKLLVQEASRRIRQKRRDVPPEDANRVAVAALRGAQLKVDDKLKTQYLLFLGEREIDDLADLCVEHWSELEKVAKGDQSKEKSKAAISKDVQTKLANLLDGGKAVDVALFGRMVADAPGVGVDAACQVAHALSVNQVDVEFDYYTAVDDLQPEEESGAGMIGTVEFNSACYYRYANVNVPQLEKNLQYDRALAKKGLDAFLKAFVLAVPTGKQNSMAAQNPPSFVMTVVGNGEPWSLANAFVKPISGRRDGLIVEAVGALDAYWATLLKMYGGEERKRWIATLHPEALTAEKAHKDFDAVLATTLNAAFPE